jgi:type I restriction enzyme S subunit
MPPPKVLEAFDSTVIQLFNRISENEKENLTLAETRDFLLPRLLSGAVTVTDAEKIVGETI